jgi:hypothetical protein
MCSEFHAYLITMYSYLDSQCIIPFNRQLSVFQIVIYSIACLYESLCPVVREIYNIGWNFSKQASINCRQHFCCITTNSLQITETVTKYAATIYYISHTGKRTVKIPKYLTLLAITDH